jgi:hypothetical protein
MYNSRTEIREIAVRNRHERTYELQATGGGYINDDDYYIYRGTPIHPVYVPQRLRQHHETNNYTNNAHINNTTNQKSLNTPYKFERTMNTTIASGSVQQKQQITSTGTCVQLNTVTTTTNKFDSTNISQQQMNARMKCEMMMHMIATGTTIQHQSASSNYQQRPSCQQPVTTPPCVIPTTEIHFPIVI